MGIWSALTRIRFTIFPIGRISQNRRRMHTMSYDLRIGVKAEGAQDLYAVIDEPELSRPTYNLRNMFVACMGWDYEQGQWYKVTEVLPMIQHGIDELEFYPSKYKKYNAPNG